MASSFEFTLNGRSVRVAGCSPNTTLLEYVRRGGGTGSKEGCAEGDCGACSVAVIERDARGRPCYRAINSCLVPLPAMAGREVVTVEGVASGAPHPVQQAMVEHHGSQCGYCTPGFILSLFEGFYRDDLKEQWQLDDQLCGNLCRCTGYRSIRHAAVEAFGRRTEDDPFARTLRASRPRFGPFDYSAPGEKFFRPGSLDDLLRLLKEFPESRLVAGATDLGLEITKRFQRFPALISLEAVPELAEVRSTETEWVIGAATTLTRLEETLDGEYPELDAMFRVFGSRQIRNRGTIGGNLVTASPIGDCAPVLLALDARLVAASAEGGRAVPISEFFTAYRKTALQAGEVLKAVMLPRAPADGVTRLRRFYKVSKRREMDISTVAACFAIEVDKGGIVRHARLAYGGVAATPIRARKSEAALIGRPWTEETVFQLLPGLRDEFTPIGDVRGSADYRQGLIAGLFEKFFREHQSGAGIAPAPPARKHEPPAGFADAGRQDARHPSGDWSAGFQPAVPPISNRQPVQRTEGALPVAGSAGWERRDTAGLGTRAASAHESAHTHVTGEAMYTDDLAVRKNALEVWPVCAPHACARILKRDAVAARSMPGIRAVLLAEDIPGDNQIGAVKKDEVLFASGEVLFHGHIVALVVGDSEDACRAAAEKVVVEYEPLPPILSIEDAVAAGSFHNEPNFMRRGDAEKGLAEAPFSFEGEFSFGGQEHFYLESQAALAEPGEDGSMLVVSSTQHPTEIQAVVAHLLGVAAAKVVVQCPRMGGGFGGKETQAATPAALAALAAARTGRPVRLRFNRDQDMMLTGKRHPFLARFTVGFDQGGALRAAKVQLYSNGGWSMDLSQAVTDRAMFHFDNAYYIPNVEIQGRVAKTHLVSNTAFRGFGGPQGMLVIEEIIDRLARRLGLPPETVRERNLYRGTGASNTTHYGQEIENNRIESIWHELKRTSGLLERRRGIEDWNRVHPHLKRGIAITPVKFGISFTATHMNQAGALVLIYQDGSVQVNHGGTEMGQGVHTNIRAIAARELGLDPLSIRVMTTATDKVPNTSATAASCGTDLNGAAVRNACQTLRARLAPVVLGLLNQSLRASAATEVEGTGDGLVFAGGFVFHRTCPDVKVKFADAVQRAHAERVSLSATGYYRTPGIHWDREKGQGHPFLYFACGAAVSEVQVDGLTGMTEVRRVDILHDAGDPINAGVSRGQIEGGFIQGMGWLTAEELKWDDKGRLLTHSPDTYKIPAIGDVPREFNVAFLKDAAQPNVVLGSKAVGEPPLMLAISVREAIRDAVAAFCPSGVELRLRSPATCEAIFEAIHRARKCV